jgi:hypothetical protein
MQRTRLRPRQLPPLQRSFERSRLEEQLVGTAYELVVPIPRPSLSPRPCPSDDATRPQQSPVTNGGLSA